VTSDDEPPERGPPPMTACRYCGAEIAGTVDDCGACRLVGDDLADYIRRSNPRTENRR